MLRLITCLLGMQQRFAEGLASHLTSGPEVDSGAGNHYDALLASLPADPAMAGLLEPLVLPADAYQIPAETDKLLAAHPLNQQASADQHQHLSHVHQTASDPGRPLETSAALCGRDTCGALTVHGSALMAQLQFVGNQEQSADHSNVAGMLELQQGTVSCQPSPHAQAGPTPCSPQLQQQDQQHATETAVQPGTVLPGALPVQQSANSLGVPAVPSHLATQQSTAPEQQAARCCEQRKLSVLLEKPVSPAPQQLQGTPSANTCLPAPDQLPQKHNVQPAGRSIDVAEQAAVDNLYATNFPDRQVLKALTGKSKHWHICGLH